MTMTSFRSISGIEHYRQSHAGSICH